MREQIVALPRGHPNGEGCIIKNTAMFSHMCLSVYYMQACSSCTAGISVKLSRVYTIIIPTLQESWQTKDPEGGPKQSDPGECQITLPLFEETVKKDSLGESYPGREGRTCPFQFS